MKKLFFLVMSMALIIINYTAASPEAKNKGSSNEEMITIMPPMSAEIVMPTAAMPADDDWIQQQNSSSNMMLKLSYAMMNKTNKLMGIADLSPRGLIMMIAESRKVPKSLLIVETSAEVQKIPNFSMVMNSSNTQMSITEMTHWRCTGMNTMTNLNSSNAQQPGSLVVSWRQNSTDMMTCCEISEMCKGANECNVKKVDSFNYALYSGSKNSADLST